MNDKYKIPPKDRCVDYAGHGFCVIENNKRCSYHGGNGVCNVRGNLHGLIKCKTGYDVQNGERPQLRNSAIAGHQVMA